MRYDGTVSPILSPKTLEEFKHNYLMTRKEADDGRDW